MTNAIKVISSHDQLDFEKSLQELVDRGFEPLEVSITGNEHGEPYFFAVLKE
jgi:hypothetical protein